MVYPMEYSQLKVSNLTPNEVCLSCAKAFNIVEITQSESPYPQGLGFNSYAVNASDQEGGWSGLVLG